MITKLDEISTVLNLLATDPWEPTVLRIRFSQLALMFSELSAELEPTFEGAEFLIAGTVVVLTPDVTAVSLIHLTNNAPSGTPGLLDVSARVPGVSFTITSSSALDTSLIAWEFSEPGP